VIQVVLMCVTTLMNGTRRHCGLAVTYTCWLVLAQHAGAVFTRCLMAQIISLSHMRFVFDTLTSAAACRWGAPPQSDGCALHAVKTGEDSIAIFSASWVAQWVSQYELSHFPYRHLSVEVHV
jgi:hypothetical protein